ncbi:MAG: LysR substrate-binding domain-containing protein [Gemmatimonadales bacterium]
MHITLDALLVLDAVDRGGSFAAGAEALMRVPSAVSHTVQKLEQDLGVAVFDRSGYRAKLTPAGSLLLKDGRELLRAAEQLEQHVKEIDAGCESCLTIAVGDLVSLRAVYALLSAFYDAPAHESTRLKITTERHATSLQTLLSGRSDILIGLPEGRASSEGVCTRVLGDVELTLAMLRTHPLARVAEPISTRMLLPYRFVRKVQSPNGDSSEFTGSNFLSVDDYDSQVEAIRHGLGIGYVPLHLVSDDVEAGRLVTKLAVDAPRLRLTVAWRAVDRGTILQWFIDQLGDEKTRSRLIPRRVRAPDTEILSGSRAKLPRLSNGAVRHDDRDPFANGA